jgi:hypothetical protein
MDSDDIENFGDEDEVVLYDEKPSKDDVIEMHQPDDSSDHDDLGGFEISFKLPLLPGSNIEELEVSSDDPLEVEEDEDKNDLKSKKDQAAEQIEVLDPWDWQSSIKKNGPDAFLHWVKERFSTIPMHNGETVGVERAISYLKKINAEISKAISNDYDGKISVKYLESARREIYSAIERLEKYLQESKKSKAGYNSDLVKEGQKSTHVGGIIVTVPIFISRLARICINGTVSAGHDIEDLYSRLVKKYALDDVKQAELMQLLADMGYPLRRDRGFNVGELIDQTSSDNMDWAANYQA